jgi:serine/threonine-protein kinase
MADWNPNANALFLTALEFQTPEERQVFLTQACGGDASLHAQVQALLQAHAAAGSFLEKPTLAGDVSGATWDPGSPVSMDAEAEKSDSDSNQQAAGSPVALPWAAAGSRYRPLRFHAKGGLGEVFVAEDTELRREVALKRIREDKTGEAASCRRFLLEAEITGKLEHPGIVPVYGSGQDTTGQPCYAMRMIQGETLQDAIQHFHKADTKPGRLSGERSLEFRGLLNRFVAVCNTIAYAHSRGVLHRDLKPANIMLGNYGETLVLDWGLARVFDRGAQDRAIDEEKLLPGPDTANGSGTETGLAMGTPAYMSPEQAAGRWQEVGPASDVYSLGATLYPLLTGKPAFADTVNVLARVQRGDFAAPRQLNPQVPAPLDAACRKAMSHAPADRYTSPRDLADDIEHWLADEPVTAYREGIPIRLGRWARRHRALLSGVAALLVTAVAALAVGLVVVNQEKDRAETALVREGKAKRRARQALDEMSSLALGDLLGRQPGKMPSEQKAFLKRALALYQEFAQEVGDGEEDRHAVARAHLRVGEICMKLGQAREAQEAYQYAIESFRGLAAEFPTVPKYRANLASSHTNLGALLSDIGHPDQAATVYREAIELLGPIAEELPAEPHYRRQLATSLNNLGNVRRTMGQPEQAEKAHREAIAVREHLATGSLAEPHDRQRLADSHMNMGGLLATTGRSGEAATEFQHALAIQEKLAAEFPDEPLYRRRLGLTHSNFAFFLAQTNRPKEAEAAWERALAIQRLLADEFPNVPQDRSALGITLNDLGVRLYGWGRLKEAETALRDALAIRKGLVANFPNVSDYQNTVAGTMVNLANLLRGQQQFSEARELLEEAQPHHQAALKANPSHTAYRQFYRNNRSVLVETLAGLGDSAGALQTAEQLSRLGWDPTTDAYKAACAMSRCILAVQSDVKLAETERARQVLAYTDRAAALLRQAVANGYRDVAQMKKDESLDPLRQRNDFKTLLDELEKPEAGSN